MDKVNLSTGKPHVSFSEMTDWAKCPFRHKLIHIDKVLPEEPSPQMAMGSAVHAGCEHFLRTREVDVRPVLERMASDWNRNKDHVRYKWFTEQKLNESMEVATGILLDIPQFLDTTFPGWTFHEAEEQLYEPLPNHPGQFFKGFIDGVIQVPGKKDLTWIIDWKTTTWGWDTDKKRDAMTRNQLVLYKSFWSRKHSVEMKTIRSGFVLLKKLGKPGAFCELVPVSVGDTSSERALKTVDNMVNSIKKGLFLKNRTSCGQCEFKNTVHCP